MRDKMYSAGPVMSNTAAGGGRVETTGCIKTCAKCTLRSD